MRWSDRNNMKSAISILIPVPCFNVAPTMPMSITRFVFSMAVSNVGRGNLCGRSSVRLFWVASFLSAKLLFVSRDWHILLKLKPVSSNKHVIITISIFRYHSVKGIVTIITNFRTTLVMAFSRSILTPSSVLYELSQDLAHVRGFFYLCGNRTCKSKFWVRLREPNELKAVNIWVQKVSRLVYVTWHAIASGVASGGKLAITQSFVHKIDDFADNHRVCIRESILLSMVSHKGSLWKISTKGEASGIECSVDEGTVYSKRADILTERMDRQTTVNKRARSERRTDTSANTTDEQITVDGQTVYRRCTNILTETSDGNITWRRIDSNENQKKARSQYLTGIDKSSIFLFAATHSSYY